MSNVPQLYFTDGALQTTRFGSTARNPSIIKNGALVFSEVYSNYGDDFKKDTGRFICEVPGLSRRQYLGNLKHSMHVIVTFVGSTPYSRAYAHTKQHTGDYPSGTASLVYQLNKGDEVYLGECSKQENMALNTHFSGGLI